jgi:hypothetical protein
MKRNYYYLGTKIRIHELNQMVKMLRNNCINLVTEVLKKLNKDNEFNEITLNLSSKNIEVCYYYGGVVQYKNNIEEIYFNEDNEIMISNEDNFDILLDDCINETIINIGEAIISMIDNDEINFENN